MKIVSIIRNPRHVPDGTPCDFRVGQPVVEGGHVVKQILFCNTGYKNGPGVLPVYVVKYEAIPEVNQIPIAEVVDVGIDPELKAKAIDPPDEANIELPD